MSTVNSEILDRISELVDDHADGNDSKFSMMINQSRSYINDLRRKKNVNPSYSVLRIIVDKFGVEEKWLLSGIGPKYHNDDDKGYPTPESDMVYKVDEKISDYEYQLSGSEVSDEHLDLLLEYIEDHSEFLSKYIKRLSSQLRVKRNNDVRDGSRSRNS